MVLVFVCDMVLFCNGFWCYKCIYISIYVTDALCILGFAFIYEDVMEPFIEKSKEHPLIKAIAGNAGDAGDAVDDDEDELEFEKNQKQKNITNIEEEPDTSKGDNNQSDIDLEGDDDKPKKDQIVKPKVNTGPTQN